MTNKALLLRVGIDTGSGGALAPLFPDGTFEYVPIPEDSKNLSPRSLYFRDLPARHGGALAQYVPARYREAAAHYDPEFETFTYGDPGRIKHSQLLRLEEGDLLIFYAGLRPFNSGVSKKLYIIGYFTVESIIKVNPWNDWPPQIYSHLFNNAHFRRARYDNNLVIIQGRATASKLLDRAIAISDEAQIATAEVEKIFGVRGSLTRSVGRWVPAEHFPNVIDWIAHHTLIPSINS